MTDFLLAVILLAICAFFVVDVPIIEANQKHEVKLLQQIEDNIELAGN